MCDQTRTSILAHEDYLMLIHRSDGHTHVIGGKGVSHMQILLEVIDQRHNGLLSNADTMEIAPKLSFHHLITRLQAGFTPPT